MLIFTLIIAIIVIAIIIVKIRCYSSDLEIDLSLKKREKLWRLWLFQPLNQSSLQSQSCCGLCLSFKIQWSFFRHKEKSQGIFQTRAQSFRCIQCSHEWITREIWLWLYEDKFWQVTITRFQVISTCHYRMC